MRGGDVERQHLDQPRQPRRLTLGQVEDEARQRGGVDDRVLERALEPAADQPGVEGVVAVLDQDGAMGEPQEGAPRVFELGRPDEHGAVDVVSPAGVRVDGSPAVDERVEERERPIEPEALGPHLEDEERRVAGRFDVERYELGVIEQGFGFDLWRIDRDLLPGHELARAARLEEEGP